MNKSDDGNPFNFDPSQERRKLRELWDAWAIFIARFPWHHFVTLTFKNPQTRESAVEPFNQWVRQIEQRAGEGIWWARADEVGSLGRVHLHALLGGTDHFDTTYLGRLWRDGKHEITPFDPAQDGAWYLTKDVPPGLSEVEFFPRTERAVVRWRRRREVQVRSADLIPVPPPSKRTGLNIEKLRERQFRQITCPA